MAAVQKFVDALSRTLSKHNAPEDMQRVPLAWIEVESYTFGEFKQVVRVPFYRDQIIKIGRDSKKSNLRFKNSTVSPVHCELYSVLFDANEQYPPLIYARDCQSASGTFVDGSLIGEGPFVTPGRLLHNNSTVSVGPCSLHIRDYVVQKTDFALGALQRKEASLFSDAFSITDTMIGHGAFADVYLAVDVKTQQQVTCKVHDLNRLRQRDRTAVLRVDREMNIWSHLDHPNIVAFRRAYRTDNTMFTFAELATGGDLFSLIEREECIPELEIKWIVIQVLRAVDYLHCKGVAHRDIKPENILCSASLHMQHRIVLADFGCSGVASLGRMTSNVGTNSYQAPEVHEPRRTHGVAVDIWAIGILVLQLLAGNEAVELPEAFHDASEVEDLVWSVNASRAGKVHGPLSLQGVEFVLACLNLAPTKRPLASQAAKHTWLTASEKERAIFKDRERQYSWKPRNMIIPAVVDYSGCGPQPAQQEYISHKHEAPGDAPGKKQVESGPFVRSLSHVSDSQNQGCNDVPSENLVLEPMDAEFPVGVIEEKPLFAVREVGSRRCKSMEDGLRFVLEESLPKSNTRGSSVPY